MWLSSFVFEGKALCRTFNPFVQFLLYLHCNAWTSRKRRFLPLSLTAKRVRAFQPLILIARNESRTAREPLHVFIYCKCALAFSSPFTRNAPWTCERSPNLHIILVILKLAFQQHRALAPFSHSICCSWNCINIIFSLANCILLVSWVTFMFKLKFE